MDGKCYMLAVTQGIQALPEMYALGQSGIHFRESPHALVTTITYPSKRLWALVCMTSHQDTR